MRWDCSGTARHVLGVSGSPIVDAYNQYIAIGLAATEGRGFARVEDALTAWGYQLR